MFHVRDNFKNLVGKAAAREFNKVAAFLNNLCAGDFMHVERPDVPTSDTPPRIALRYDALSKRFVTGDPGVKEPAGTTAMTSGGPFSGGADNSVMTFGSASGSGAVIYVACRGVKADGQAAIYFRPFTISGDGRIYSIGAESSNLPVYAP